MARTFPTNVTDPLWTVMAEGGPVHARTRRSDRPSHAIHEKGRSPRPAYLNQLEATGRSDGAAKLRAKYGC